MTDILLCVKDRSFREAYIAALARFIGVDAFAVHDDIESIVRHTRASNGHHTIVFDTIMLTEAPLPLIEHTLKAIFGPARCVVLLNCEHAPAIASLIASVATCEPQYVDGVIPESQLLEIVKDVGAALRLSRDPTAISRIKHETPHEHSEPLQSLQEDTDVLETLRFIRGRLHTNAELLRDLFVTKSSNVRLTESESSTLPTPSDIPSVVGRLHAFFGADAHGSDGRVIIGEKGAGKTTLVHYAAATYSDQHNSFLFLSVDYQWIAYYDTEGIVPSVQRALQEMDPDFPTGNDPQIIVDCANERIRGECWKSYPAPTLEAQIDIRTFLRDPAVRSGLYFHFTGTPLERLRALDTYGDSRYDLEIRIGAWIQSLLDEPRLAVLMILVFTMHAERDQFLSFTWDRIRASLESNIDRSMKCGLSPAELPLLSTSSSEAEKTAHELHKIGLSTLSHLAGTNRVVVCFDNVDQRLSERLEVSLLRNIAALVHDMQRLFPCKAVISMRNSTYAGSQFRRVDLERQFRMSMIQTTPPDLMSVLRKRAEMLRCTALGVGGKHQWFVEFLCRWIHGMVAVPGQDNLLKVITARFPHDVRAQLDAFSEVALSIHVHHMRLRALQRGGISRFTTFGDVSEEFCVRAMLWGSRPFYEESGQSVAPNLFDNGFETSPFNAVLRGWVLRSLRQRDTSLEQLVGDFCQCGIDRGEITVAIDSLIKFGMLRESYESAGIYRLTRWGDVFSSRIAFDLPYIQTVWWDTRMLSDYDIGPPVVLEWHQLESRALRFAAWIRIEQEIAVHSIRRESLSFLEPLLFEQEIHTAVAFSLHRIGQAVGLWRNASHGEHSTK